MFTAEMRTVGSVCMLHQCILCEIKLESVSCLYKDCSAGLVWWAGADLVESQSVGQIPSGMMPILRRLPSDGLDHNASAIALTQ